MVKVQFSILNEVFYNAKSVHPHGEQNRGNVRFIHKAPCRSNEHGGSPKLKEVSLEYQNYFFLKTC